MPIKFTSVVALLRPHENEKCAIASKEGGRKESRSTNMMVTVWDQMGSATVVNVVASASCVLVRLAR